VVALSPLGRTVHYWRVRTPPPGYQTVSPYLLYEDAPRLIEHLKSAFGFEERLSQTGAGGRSHTELVLGDDGLVFIGQAWEGFSSPRSLGVHPPSLTHVYVSDVDALHQRARAAGAEVTDLEMAPVGDRRFTATDPEGQIWVFAQRVASPAS
jgi:uncharacterized glyoxalase superfamily protein PhnB